MLGEDPTDQAIANAEAQREVLTRKTVEGLDFDSASAGALAALDEKLDAEFKIRERELRRKMDVLHDKSAAEFPPRIITISDLPPFTRSLVLAVPAIESSDSEVVFKYRRSGYSAYFSFSWEKVKKSDTTFSGFELCPFYPGYRRREPRLLAADPLVPRTGAEGETAVFERSFAEGRKFCDSIMSQSRFRQLGLINELINLTGVSTAVARPGGIQQSKS